MIAMACITLTAALLFYVFGVPSQVEQAPEKTRLSFLRERKEMIYENLRDLNFEYKAGKVPESDYLALRASLEQEAAAVMAEMDTLEPPAGFSPDPKGVRV